MNAKNLIAAFAVFAATGSAFAQPGSEFVDFVNVPSAKTRAEVKAELAQAQSAGRAEFVDFSTAASETPRATVRTEVKKAYDTGLLNNRKEYVEFVNVASIRSRDEVRNEAMQAARAGNDIIGG